MFLKLPLNSENILQSSAFTSVNDLSFVSSAWLRLTDTNVEQWFSRCVSSAGCWCTWSFAVISHQRGQILFHPADIKYLNELSEPDFTSNHQTVNVW